MSPTAFTTALKLALHVHLRTLRLKQVDVARAVGVTPGTLSGWLSEHGPCPSVRKLAELSEVLGVPVSLLAKTAETQGEWQ